jgi:hypothetical protein
MSRLDPAAIGSEIERLVQEVSELGDTRATERVQELVRLLMSLYGAGLARALDIVRTERGGPDAVLGRFATDPLLASLLVLHDLHPHPVDARVERALKGLEPHLPAQTQLTLVSVDDTSVHVRVDRAGNGDARGGGNTRLAIERAIQEAAPEIGTIHIDGLDEALIQILRSAHPPAP